MPFSIPHRFRIVAFRRDLLSDYPTSSSNIEYILSGSERYIHIKAEALDQPVFYGARYRGLDTRYVAWQAMQRRASQGLQHLPSQGLQQLQALPPPPTVSPSQPQNPPRQLTTHEKQSRQSKSPNPPTASTQTQIPDTTAVNCPSWAKTYGRRRVHAVHTAARRSPGLRASDDILQLP